ncbi:MAG: divalent-cation tolerance protein CutA [Deltaproteobacteria bacterium]|nr:divalent-cation tolerance protein CutA [Deltaproteobacteria bacterium]
MKIVLTNLAPDDAPAIAKTLVAEGLVACVNLYPVRSIYRWEGQVCDEPEMTMMMKVATEGVKTLRARLEQLHPYDVMEFVVLEVDAEASLPAYVQWVREHSRG